VGQVAIIGWYDSDVKVPVRPHGDYPVSRQFTDGEISAAIGRIATEGGTLSRAVVRKRLGGGSSSRIDALLKDYRRNGAGPSNGTSGRLPAEVALPRTARTRPIP
jgi:hypothetical protein